MENKERRKTRRILKKFNPKHLLRKLKSSDQAGPAPTPASALLAQPNDNSSALPAPLPSAQPQESLSLFKSPWEKAIAKLKKDYPNEFGLDVSDPRLTITDVLEAVKAKRTECEEKQWKYRGRNGKMVGLKNVADKILNNLNQLAPNNTGTSQHRPQTASVVWTTLRDILLKVASNDREIMQNLLPEIEYISSILERCRTYEALYKDSKHECAHRLICYLPDLYASILMYLLSSQRYFSQNDAVRCIKSSVNPYTAVFGPLVEEIRKQEGIVETAARSASGEFLIKEMKQLKKKKMNTDEELFNVLAWLSEIPFEEHHSFVRGFRQPNTGNWLLEKREFIDWKNSPVSSILWLHGIVGAGKTTLASLVIDAFEETKSIDHAVAYFYCRYEEKERQDPVSILRSIVKQLSLMGSEGSLPESVLSIYHKLKKHSFMPRCLELSECLELISDLSAGFKQTAIIFDALFDECEKDSRKQLLDTLDKILSSSTGAIKIFVTSRDTDDRMLKLEGVPNFYISSRNNSGDIAAFVIAEVQKCISERTLLRGSVDQKLQNSITEKLTNEANGMFLWVRLQIKSICEQKTPDAIHKALGRSPEGLKAIYSVIWDKICEQSKENLGLAIRTLKWVMCPKSPLTIDAIVKAVSVEPTDWTGNLKHDYLSVTDLLEVCHNLVVIDEELGVLRTAHFSVNEFLRGKIEMSEAHTLAAGVCLTLMCDSNLYSPVESIYHHPLRTYVIENWVHHIRLSGDGRNNLLVLLKTFLSPSPTYDAWLKEARSTTCLGSPFHSEAQLTPLWISCYYQLWDVCKDLLSGDVDCNVCNIHGIMPLHLAAMHGNDVIVKLLIENQNVDLDSKDNHNRSALWHASSEGQTAVVKLLLDKGAIGLNSKASNDTPYRHSVGISLKKQSDDSFYRVPSEPHGLTALSVAALWGHEEVVKLLLDTKGVDLNFKDNIGRTPLLCAAGQGRNTVVKRLLATNGVDSNCKDNAGRTLLWYTARNGNETAVKLSLAMADVDLNAADDEGITPLLVAASEGKDAIVKLLLDTEGVDTNCKDNSGRTLLWHTARSGNETAVKLSLATENVDLNAADHEGITPLLAAASEGNDAIVKLLLDTEGVDSNCKDNSGRTLLWHTARNGNETAVRLSLATEGVDLNAADHEGITPLLAAASEGKGAIVKLLQVTEGVDSNCKDNSGRTLLWHTARSGNETAPNAPHVTEDIDLNAAEDKVKTPLSAAVSEGNGAIVKLLLDTEGMDSNREDYSGKILLR